MEPLLKGHKFLITLIKNKYTVEKHIENNFDATLKY